MIFADVIGLAGNWTHAASNVGFEVQARKSLPNAWGDQHLASNPDLFPGPWEAQSCEPADWDPCVAGLLAGTPPCSAFAATNRAGSDSTRGPDSATNQCMWDMIRYAKRCRGTDGRPGPEVVAFESVQGAYIKGRDLMYALTGALGPNYHLTHVLMSGAMAGSPQHRKRYYFVAHRIPFGIDPPFPKLAVTAGERIGHWQSSWPYEDLWLHQRESLWELIEDVWELWEPGTYVWTAVLKFHERYGRKPRGITDHRYQSFLNGQRWAPIKLHHDLQSPLLCGQCTTNLVHWAEPRPLSVEECSLLMGWPEGTNWRHRKTPGAAGAMIGRCAPVESCQWLSWWIKQALLGAPGRPGEPQRLGESYINYTKEFMQCPQ